MRRESKRGNFHKGVIYTKYARKTYLPKCSRFLINYKTKRTNSIFTTKCPEFVGLKNVVYEKSPRKIFKSQHVCSPAKLTFSVHFIFGEIYQLSRNIYFAFTIHMCKVLTLISVIKNMGNLHVYGCHIHVYSYSGTWEGTTLSLFIP